MKLKLFFVVLFLKIGVLYSQYLITDPDSLHNNSADYVIITHQDFTDAVLPLCHLRDSLGHIVKMAEASLIYSTFNGSDNSGDIKEFIQNAYDSWVVKPEYILLVGDASKENDENDFIPSRHFPKFSYSYLGNLQTHSSDNWYVQLDGDDYIPDIAIGRLTVNTVESCEKWVEKIIAYEKVTGQADWRKRVTIVASSDFDKYAEPLCDSFFDPQNDIVNKVYESSGSSSSQLRQMTVDAFNDGTVLLFMVAHGSTTPLWSGSKTIFHYQDIPDLQNDVYPIVFGRG